VTPAGSKSQDFEIPRCYAKDAKKRLDNIVNYIAAEMRNPAPDNKGVRSALGSTARALDTAQRHLKKISSEKSWAFNSLAIATMVNDDWLREISLGEFQPTPWSARTPFGPNHGLAKREDFVEQSPFKIAAEIIGEIAAASAPSFELMTAINKRGGRKAFTYRKLLVSNLVSMWEDWARAPIGGRRSNFVTFCERQDGADGRDPRLLGGCPCRSRMATRYDHVPVGCHSHAAPTCR
jgi:hypothetical protein